jgi:pSer/pThr/pTyr-binding forkhead associated (FHA) protein
MVKLDVVIMVDPSLADEENGAQCPVGETERVFPLDLNENLVGRRSDAKGVFPEIMIDDPGVSRRHLKFNKQPDGSFAVLELGSANGTRLNGSDLEAGVVTPVSEGDELTIGMWTRLKLRPRG